MPRRLLREPHVLAHELRTPLSILAGWYSLIRDGDISQSGTPAQWQRATASCQQAIERLNFIISQACDEAGALRWPEAGDGDRRQELYEEASRAIDRTRESLASMETRPRRRSSR